MYLTGVGITLILPWYHGQINELYLKKYANLVPIQNKPIAYSKTKGELVIMNQFQNGVGEAW